MDSDFPASDWSYARRRELKDDAFLRLMGCREAPSESGGRLYQFLARPAFFPPSCVTFDDRLSRVECNLVVLRSSWDDVFDAYFSPTPDAFLALDLSKRRCDEYTAEVPTADGVTVRRLLTPLDPKELEGRDLSGYRDGISFLVRYVSPDAGLRLRVEQPDYRDTPTHFLMLWDMLDAASAAFPSGAATESLRAIRGYLDWPAHVRKRRARRQSHVARP